MTADELRQKFLDFMKSKGHVIIPSASLIPENDPSVLFTTAGMFPLVPYLMGEKHPEGKRVANVQKCIRTGDIDEVGDNRHLTFFEMLGNWSFGDYFKKEAVEWSFEFLTSEKWLGLDPKRIYISVFKGDDDLPKDDESIKNWQVAFKNIRIEAEVAGEDFVLKDNIRIIPLGKEDNVWIAGETGPCGPNTEMYYDTRPEEGTPAGKFSDLVDNFRLIEIWNDVFMEFNKTADGKYEKLSQHNVDTGMGIERTLAVINGEQTVFDGKLFEPTFEKIEEISGKKYGESEEITKSMRIIADHIKAATFIMADDKDISPSNLGQGYVARRLIRRAIRHGKILGIQNDSWTKEIAKIVAFEYRDVYSELPRNIDKVIKKLEEEEDKFSKTLDNGIKHYQVQSSNFKVQNDNSKLKIIPGYFAFDLYQTYGFPLELTQELGREDGLEVDVEQFDKLFKEHQEKSRTASKGMFKGGLADSSEETKRLHTAAHLLLAALRKVLGELVRQKGSNITPERLRFDFSYPEKMTEEQKKEVEKIVNEQIQKDLPVSCEEMSLEEATKQNAMGVFKEKYGERVKVYSIGDVSKEICGGPHVSHAGELGHFKIVKEESSSAGVRRIKAILE